MIHYKLTWHIDIEADSPLEAAQIALGIQRDPESIATVFTVQGPDSCICIDADNGEELPSDHVGYCAVTGE